MTNDKSPKELCLHTVIAMDYAVAGVYNIFGMRKLKRGVFFQYTVYCFTHYFRLSFYGANAQPIFFELVKTLWITCEKTLQFIYGIKHILKMLQNIFIGHKSVV